MVSDRGTSREQSLQRLKVTMKSAAFGLMTLACVGVCGYALFGYLMQQPGSTVHPAMKAVFVAHVWGIRLHVLGAAIALLLGPLQFHERTRERFPKLHRATGYAYSIAGVLVGGLSGLWMAQFSYGGLVSQTGFGLLAILWLTSCAVAVNHAIRRNLVEHRRWMVRNFAMTLAAVTLRVQLGIFFAAGFDFDVFYPLLAWTSWVPNLFIAEWFLLGGRGLQRPRPPIDRS